jgi:hypothetical protein
MTRELDGALFERRMTAGTRNVIASAKDLFTPPFIPTTISSLAKFATVVEPLIEGAPTSSTKMGEALEHSRESSRQFIKAASELFGQITVALGTVSA